MQTFSDTMLLLCTAGSFGGFQSRDRLFRLREDMTLLPGFGTSDQLTSGWLKLVISSSSSSGHPMTDSLAPPSSTPHVYFAVHHGCI